MEDGRIGEWNGEWRIGELAKIFYCLVFYSLMFSVFGILYSDFSLALGTPSLDRVADRFTIVGADAGFCRSRRWVQIHHKLPRHKV